MNRFLPVLLLLIACGGGGGDEELPRNLEDSSSCDGDVHYTPVAEEPSKDEGESDEQPTESSEPEGCELSPICRALKQARAQGLKVFGYQKFDGVTIIGTCGANIDVSVDSGNVTTSIDGEVQE